MEGVGRKDEEEEGGRRVRMTNRRVWIEGVEWRWVEEREEWKRIEE